MLSPWTCVAAEPEAFLALRLCTPAWLVQALPALLDAEARRDDYDPALGLQAVRARLEGGPLPDEVVGDAAAAACLSGLLAARRPIPERELRIALPWAARALSLPSPDGTWAREACDRATLELDAGAITQEQWYARVEEPLVDAYLSHDDPRAQSGKSGDEADWRWSRELVLDTFEGDGKILDVGCANGYLMQSLERWGRERGRRIEAYGLEISARLAAFARRRAPELAERIWTGNIVHFEPPLRFDVVHLGLEYVPVGRRRDLVQHILAHFLRPGGLLVLRAERVRPRERSIDDDLRDHGIEPDGACEATHPRTGERRRTVWLRRGFFPTSG